MSPLFHESHSLCELRALCERHKCPLIQFSFKLPCETQSVILGIRIFKYGSVSCFCLTAHSHAMAWSLKAQNTLRVDFFYSFSLRTAKRNKAKPFGRLLFPGPTAGGMLVFVCRRLSDKRKGKFLCVLCGFAVHMFLLRGKIRHRNYEPEH